MPNVFIRRCCVGSRYFDEEVCAARVVSDILCNVVDCLHVRMCTKSAEDINAPLSEMTIHKSSRVECAATSAVLKTGSSDIAAGMVGEMSRKDLRGVEVYRTDASLGWPGCL